MTPLEKRILVLIGKAKKETDIIKQNKILQLIVKIKRQYEWNKFLAQ